MGWFSAPSPVIRMRRKMFGLAKNSFLLGLLAVTLVALSGCGESKEEKALTAACTAKDDIGKQVETLKSLTPATFKTETVQSSLNSIYEDLKTINDQIPALKSDVKAQVQSANQEFRSSLSQVAVSLGKSLSLNEGKQDVQDAAAKLASSYQQAFASLNCAGS